MPASTAFAQNVALLVLNNTAIADIGNTAGLQPSSVAGNLYLALYTASPGVTGSPTTNETAYTGYARVAVPRTTAGWNATTTAGAFQNAAAAAFPACTGGTSTVTYFAVISVATAGAVGDLLLLGALTSSLTISSGVTPSFAAGALTGTVS